MEIICSRIFAHEDSYVSSKKKCFKDIILNFSLESYIVLFYIVCSYYLK